MSVCRSCGADVIWAKTPAGKSIPLDPGARRYGGNIDLVEGVALVIPKDERAGAGMLYVSHFATCVNAAKHRRPK